MLIDWFGVFACASRSSDRGSNMLVTIIFRLMGVFLKGTDVLPNEPCLIVSKACLAVGTPLAVHNAIRISPTVDVTR